MDNGRIVPLLQYVISLAITEAIKYICNQHGLPYLDVRIKWPNDLYLNGMYFRGILCTSTYRSKKFNVSAAIFSDYKVVDVNLNGISTLPIGQNRVCLMLLTTLVKCHSDHVRFYDNTKAIMSKYRFSNSEELCYQTRLNRVCWTVQDIYPYFVSPFPHAILVCRSLTLSSYLLPIGDDNEMCQLHPDGNREVHYLESPQNPLATKIYYCQFPLHQGTRLKEAPVTGCCGFFNRVKELLYCTVFSLSKVNELCICF
ncbi:hypothetical protein SAY87_011516 [Trapa incisa]|uniref:BPL/LPL catalytic domain-containing protein n=1 Tax=Trapa incisa TaxID=236973 RepID=A0AAN7GND4_9MYRT|nr:hypothetical protein SAY87_011516 [Trapa incisa]